MKFNEKFESDIDKFKDYVIIVEGKKDVSSLNALGFSKVYMIHQTSMSVKERAEEILKQIEKRDKICILTDFDKKGKRMYMTLKPIFQELGARLDSSLRGLLLKARISHIEGLYKYLNDPEKP